MRGHRRDDSAIRFSAQRSKKMHGLSIGILASIGTSLFSWYLAYDTVVCNVVGAGSQAVNGYYSAVGGIYFKRGVDISYFPDVFEIFALRRDISGESTIAITKHSWAVFSNLRKQIVYRNSPEHPEEYIYSPPASGWTVVDDGKIPAPSVTGCRGSLQDSPPLPSAQVSNIAQLFQRPVTSVLLGIIFYAAYVLWSSRTEVSDVSFSYHAVVNQGEYWRMMTSSFSHFDAWHLLFNTMSLYQLGELEVTYGSVTFAYLNADLVFITMGICVLFSHIMITKFARTDQTYAQAVGFSCVLFAWMVAASVRMKQYCPIFLFPALCFTTYYIPNPLASYNFGPQIGFPVNIGPILLLVITKVIIPRSSFLGHLSGIVIGYPLAWNALNWLTPPLAFALVGTFFIYQKNLFPSKFPGYESSAELSDLGPPAHVSRYCTLSTTMKALAVLSVLSVLILGPTQLIPRVVFVWVIWSAVQARRCEWLTTLRAVHEDCLCVLYLACVGCAVAVLYDLSSLGAAVAAKDLLTGCGLTIQYVYLSIGLLAVLSALEMLFLTAVVTCVNDIKLSESVMTLWRLNAVALQKDAKMLGLHCLPCCTGVGGGDGTGTGSGGGGLLGRHVFEGPGRRAVSTPTAQSGGEESRLLPAANNYNSSKSSNTSVIDIKSKIGQKIVKIDVPAPAPFPPMPHTATSSLV